MAKQKGSQKWLNDGEAVVIFRNTGQVLNHAQVKDKIFRIDTPDLAASFGRRLAPAATAQR